MYNSKGFFSNRPTQASHAQTLHGRSQSEHEPVVRFGGGGGGGGATTDRPQRRGCIETSGKRRRRQNGTESRLGCRYGNNAAPATATAAATTSTAAAAAV